MSTVLVVDDSSSIRQMVSFTLKSVKYEVVDAVNGQDGLNKAKSNKIDLVVTDLNMPIMDGLTMIQELRKIPQFKTTPMLLLTTESSQAMKDKGRAVGATGWLVKPFDPNKLIELTVKLIGKA